MKEIVYSLEDFKVDTLDSITFREKLKLNFEERSIGQHGFVVLTAKLYLPTSENVILVCEFPSTTYNRLFLDSEKKNGEGEEAKRIKDYGIKIRTLIKDKLGVAPVDGRWEE